MAQSYFKLIKTPNFIKRFIGKNNREEKTSVK